MVVFDGRLLESQIRAFLARITKKIELDTAEIKFFKDAQRLLGDIQPVLEGSRSIMELSTENTRERVMLQQRIGKEEGEIEEMKRLDHHLRGLLGRLR